MSNSLTVTAANGREFTVVYLPTGTPKPSGSLTDAPTVEFYDLTGGQQIAANPNQTRHLDDDAIASLANVGHFTGGRYYVATILGEDEWSNGAEDSPLCLMYPSDEWTLDGDTMRDVRAWLRDRRAAA